MQVRDTAAGYGLPTRIIHWGMAVAIVGMYVLGLWMVDLNYYSPYYRTAPDIHRSVGMLLPTVGPSIGPGRSPTRLATTRRARG